MPCDEVAEVAPPPPHTTTCRYTMPCDEVVEVAPPPPPTTTCRYTMPRDEVVEVAKWALDNNLGNIMLQSGELDTPQRNQYIEDMVRKGGRDISYIHI